MAATTPSSSDAVIPLPTNATFLGHPAGLFLLFLVEMWERFSYYGMRGLLVLYLTSPTGGMRNPPPGVAEGFNPGRGWDDPTAYSAYGWYTGLAYLTPIVGGMIADKFIGTHRSMIVGGILIALGHIVLGISGLGDLAHNSVGLSLFVMGLALIVIGTGHFKPSVSVMVGQLYPLNDPRRETAFGIFYMGINLGSALQVYIVGTLGEWVGWHWGFSAAAAGMIAGLILYMFLRPKLLGQVGAPACAERARVAPMLLPTGIALATLVAIGFHFGVLTSLDLYFSNQYVIGLIVLGAVSWAVWFVLKHPSIDRGPVISIFLFMLFNAVFWLSFEQAGSSINVFTDRLTDRSVTLPSFITDLPKASALLGIILAGFAGLISAFCTRSVFRFDRQRKYGKAVVSLALAFGFGGLATVGLLQCLGKMAWLSDFKLVPTTWFQSVNPWLIIVFAPITGVMWTSLSRRNANPSQPVKIAIGLVFVGLGYLFMVAAALQAKDPVKASMWLIAATYFVHTMGEIVLSPTGLSYVTKAAPRQSVSLLMGIWFVSSFIANLGAGKVAAMVDPILKGEKQLPWHLAGGPAGSPNSQADFFFLFVITSCGAGVLVLAFTPLLKKLMRNPND